MKHKTNLTLITLALAAGVSTAFAQTNWLSDDFQDPALTGWTTGGFPGTLTQINQQLVISENFFGSAQTNNPLATHGPAIHAFPNSGPLPDQQTLEVRTDLVSASQNGLAANIALNWAAPALGSGYMLSKAEDWISLLKFYNGASSYAYFFYTNQPVKNQNVTLILALTRDGSNVKIASRVLDKDNANAILFDRTVTDTPQADPVLPNRAAGGFISMADPPGTSWPAVMAPAYVELAMTWSDPQQAPQHPAQVIYDNLEVWQYQTPQLNIQNAVVLSRPATAAQFVVESAPGVNGPWETVPEPWLRTNATQIQMSVLASDSMRLFRLRFAP
jgi:hypothetical protein